MTRAENGRWDDFAVADAFALRSELAIALVQPVLDPRLRPLLDHARRLLHAVRDEAGLDAAVAGFRPLVDVLATWPSPRGGSQGDGGAGEGGAAGLSRADRRIVRFSAAVSALWALCHGPGDERGRRLARTAVEQDRRGALGEPAGRVPFLRDFASVNSVTGIADDPDPSQEAPVTPRPTGAAPDVVEALAPARSSRADALSRPTARRIERALRSAPRGLTAQEIAEAVGRHHTGVRAQLAELERARVVQVQLDPPAGRGRPPRRYVLAPDPSVLEAAGHRELVRLLMSLVREAGFGPEDVERFGERQGAGIARAGGGPDEIRDAFERLGFDPHEAGGDAPADLVLARCPFADGVEAPHGQVICLLHRGLARGIARAAAPGIELVDLDIKEPRQAGCRLRLAPRAPTHDGAAAA